MAPTIVGPEQARQAAAAVHEPGKARVRRPPARPEGSRRHREMGATAYVSLEADAGHRTIDGRIGRYHARA